MDFDPGLLVIILFIIAPLLEKLFKAGSKQEPPPAPRPRPPVPQQPRPQPRPVPPARTQQQDENAVDILPEDLWAILTGEQRPPSLPPSRPAPEPVRLPAPVPVPQHRPEAGHSYDEEAVEETSQLPQRRNADEYIPIHAQPVVVSLEQLEIDDEARHVAFHEKVAARRRPSAAAQVERPVEHRYLSDHDLRRAMILTEVLGKPRGLE